MQAKIYLKISDNSMIFTEQALVFFHKQSVKNKLLYWVISMRKVGCSGYQYSVTWQDNPYGHVTSMGEWFVCIDPQWEHILKQVTVDVQSDALGQKKVVYRNPLTSSMCGCGESFMIASS